MSAAAKSVLAFAAYMLLLGAALVLAPNPLLVLFGVPATTEVWIRLIGVLVLCLSYYYVLAARRELVAFFRGTVHGRLFVAACIAAFVLVGLAPSVLLVFGAIDLAGALWTGASLRRTG
jgi:hypothetical protein